MGSKSKGRKWVNPNNNNNYTVVIGKGNVTPPQLAFIVDRYLADNNFSRTRSAFLSEASSLFSKSSINEVPKSLMSLGELLDEYIYLKGQKLIIENEKCGLAQERCRIQTLLHGMQDVMNVYNSAATVGCLTPPPPPPPPPVSPPVSSLSGSAPVTSPAGNPASRTPVMTSVSMTQSVKMDRANFTTPVAGGRPPRKRRVDYMDLEDVNHAPKKVYSGPLANYPFPSKVSKTVEQPSNARRSKQFPPLQSSSPSSFQAGPPIQGSSVAKPLFHNALQSPTSNSSGPTTPPQALSCPSDKAISPIEDVSSTGISHHRIITPPDATPTNCTIISSKTIIVSPAKRYSIERNEYSFSSPAKPNSKLQSERNHVKARLDFDSSENVSGDGSTTSESEKEGDVFDLDLPSFDEFGPDFSLSEFLTEFGIAFENPDYSCPIAACDSSGAIVESFHERNNKDLSTGQDLLEHSSAMTEVIAADNTAPGSDSVTSVTSVRKCIRIVSPTKNARNSPVHYQENLCRKS